MKRVSPKTILYLVGLVGALVYLAVAMTSMRPRPAKPKRSAEAKPAAKAEAGGVRLVQAAPADADFTRYQLVVARNIFSPPAPPPPAKQAPIIPPPLVLRPEDMREKPPAPPTPPSLTNWSYVGYVAIDGRSTGIIQNDETRSIKELQLGEQFQGYRVEAITREEMALSFGATKTSLKKPLDFPIVPLEGTAGGSPQPGRPGGPRPRGGGPPEHP